jgi:proline iminopeptidase
MAHFTSYDGAKLASAGRVRPPLVCLPGGPGRVPGYLGNLGGLGRSRELILPDIRGTGDSEVPADPAAYRCDRIARDVEAFRADLGLDQMDLLGHSAGGNVALLYAAAHPERISRLILLTPGVRALGLTFTDEEQLAAMRRRAAEPWFESAWAAVQAAEGGDDSAETTLGWQPFRYGRWDDAARAHAAAGLGEETGEVRAGFYAEGGVRPFRDPGRAGRPDRTGARVRGRAGRRRPARAAGRGGRPGRPVPPGRDQGAAGRRSFPLAG